MKYLLVDRKAIHNNAHDGGERPVIAILDEDGTKTLCSRVRINGPSEIVYSPVKTLQKTGSHVWIEAADADVEVLG